MTDPNLLYYGDNLDVLRRHCATESVDLVYLDPPFKSNADYNILFEEHGAGSAAQIQAFEDTWEWNEDSARVYQETVEKGGNVARVLKAFRSMLGDTDMLAYLAMMAPRLVELHRVLKGTGSLYLHCDPTASAYLRVLLDAIFGAVNFRNEIVWYYYNKMHDSRKRLFPRATDTLLFYVKDVESEFTFHQLKEQREAPIRQLARAKKNGRMVNVKDDAGKLVYRLSTERTLDNVWRIPMLQPAARERLGYPTQKPEALLERVILASTNPGDLVLDPFCGCGTAVAVAQRLDRRWIGIDITHLAIGLIKNRLLTRFGAGITVSYRVVGEPTTVEDAAVLARDDPFQFQAWALGLVGARPEGETKKGADQGVDGRLYFHDEGPAGRTKQIIFSVKAGHTGPGHVRDLIGTIGNEGADIGVLLTFEEPTKPMRGAAASAGFYTSPWGTHPRIQLLTVGDLLAATAKVDYPTQANVTLKAHEPEEPTDAPSIPMFDE